MCAINNACEFSFTSRLTAGVSFEIPRYYVVTSYFTPLANLPRSGAQQIPRVRNVNFRTGFFAVDNIWNRRMLALPLGLEANKELCLSREHFSLNIQDE